MAEKKKKDTTATEIVELATAATVELFADERDEAYARIPAGNHYEQWRIESRRFRSWLARAFYEKKKRVPGSSALADAVNVLTGKARFDGRRITLHNRLAWAGDSLYIDMADPQWRTIRLDLDGWVIVEGAPALFRRYSHQAPQVVPQAGGSMDLLDDFLNIEDLETRLLLKVAVAVALIPDIPRVVILFYGPQGSAKSTSSRMVRLLVDPSQVPSPSFPHSEAEMAQLLDHHAMCVFDNISYLGRRYSDRLCRAVTGDGFQKRKLYSDDDDILYAFKRQIALNGISIPATAPDLLDRSLLIGLHRLENPKEEAELWADFEKARPLILGAMLDALVEARSLLPSIRLAQRERMADWCRWGYAVAEAIGESGDRFLLAYRENRRRQNEEALDSHPVGAAVIAFMESRDEWTGTPATLLDKLTEVAGDKRIIDKKHPPKLWPKAANWVTRRLHEVQPNLAETGIQFTEDRTAGARLLTLLQVPDSEETENTVSTVTAVTGDDDSDAGDSISGSCELF